MNPQVPFGARAGARVAFLPPRRKDFRPCKASVRSFRGFLGLHGFMGLGFFLGALQGHRFKGSFESSGTDPPPPPVGTPLVMLLKHIMEQQGHPHRRVRTLPRTTRMRGKWKWVDAVLVRLTFLLAFGDICLGSNSCEKYKGRARGDGDLAM